MLELVVFILTILASKMLRRRIPQSGHLMTAKKFWLQTVPCNVGLCFTIHLYLNIFVSGL